jgi:ABC-2 type transport system ATP-binding protein
MITIRNLSVSYSKKKVLSNIKLNIPLNSIYGIVGLNGAGKTTLFNTIYGIKKKDTGTILFNETIISKKSIGYLETENFFYSNITGIEYLRLFLNNRVKIEKWNNLFELPLNELIDNYSTGMKKKIALLSIIFQNKPILILDEPFNGLDLQASRTLSSIIKEISKTRTVIISSHILDTLLNLCDTISYLKNGKIEFTKNENEFSSIEKEIFIALDEKNNALIKKLIND